MIFDTHMHCDFSTDSSMTLEEAIVEILAEKKMTLTTAESCTGGMIAEACTAISGSSSWLRGSIVAYGKPHHLCDDGHI